ncbi:type VI secretion system-associated protein TagF [Simiduia sp. 21SJ11W-1]|uniref:type VI secretion system-associated protein TagF n=1 Tax=Simiduia sp. 21SJ11W-1 TaxID=2909669 RepID=UPI00209DDC07|nr:type VI secretion system-associated protein TagF [Simiduia sp. 21SJ11W-1]UTA46619.1 type VI secretion system-associated protein TagF [Simiduia sp. 21SJ11W-1]
MNIGLFGKLPAHGDFVERNLARSFLSVWDDWLQRAMANSQDIAGEQWIDYYLTAPVWHFALGHGVIDASPWIGIVLPSVDSVGRYFPFTVVKKLGAEQQPFAELERHKAFFEEAAARVIDAMQHGHNIEQLADAVANIEQPHTHHACTALYWEATATTFYQGDTESLASALTQMSYAHARAIHTSSSLWYTDASEALPSNCFTLQGLPPAEYFWPMISNQWHWT